MSLGSHLKVSLNTCASGQVDLTSQYVKRYPFFASTEIPFFALRQHKKCEERGKNINFPPLLQHHRSAKHDKKLGIWMGLRQ